MRYHKKLIVSESHFDLSLRDHEFQWPKYILEQMDRLVAYYGGDIDWITHGIPDCCGMDKPGCKRHVSPAMLPYVCDEGMWHPDRYEGGLTTLITHGRSDLAEWFDLKVDPTRILQDGTKHTTGKLIQIPLSDKFYSFSQLIKPTIQEVQACLAR